MPLMNPAQVQQQAHLAAGVRDAALFLGRLALPLLAGLRLCRRRAVLLPDLWRTQGQAVRRWRSGHSCLRHSEVLPPTALP